jgi:hypothetical protein
MFAKIFTQILDSSIAEDYRVRHIFEDLLKLCDPNGVVDMTRESIARRLNVPVEIVRDGIAKLETPDPQSRNPDHDGRRIMRLDEHRDWGWSIVNYDLYRGIASEEDRRQRTKARVQKLRERRKQPDLPSVEPGSADSNAPVTPGNAGNAPVTPGNAGNAMQKQKQKQRDFDKASGPMPEPGSNPPAHTPTKPKKLSKAEKGIADRFEAALAGQWVNDAGKWIGRIKGNDDKCERVIAEVENGMKEGRIGTTPAQFAEDTWKRFA